jgi:predicted PhzF superfamily epimerase YddE/YHI9
MGRDARLEVSVGDGGSRIDIGGRAITLIDGSIEV